MFNSKWAYQQKKISINNYYKKINKTLKYNHKCHKIFLILKKNQ